MLKAICYVSNKNTNIIEEELERLLSKIVTRNNQLDINGLLMLRNNHFFQIMEGQETIIDDIFEKIKADGRHHGMIMLLNQPIEDRIFADYESGQFTLIRDSERFKKLRAYFDWIKNAGLVEIDKLINLTSNFLKYNK